MGILHRHFQCNMGDGSFVKTNKVTKGRLLIDSLRERYVGFDAPTTVGPDSIIPDAYVITSKGHQKSIEFIGEIKIRCVRSINPMKLLVEREQTFFRLLARDRWVHSSIVTTSNNKIAPLAHIILCKQFQAISCSSK